jgi:hypothetical protein
MPRNKDLKRLVRARMKKTGEAYTAARAQITRKTQPTRPTPPAKAIDFAELAGMSDAAVKEATGCTWERWVRSLDHYGASTMSHRDIAALVTTKYKVPSWWSQTVTVGYERIKGLRAHGQKRDGSYGATKSRTFDVPVTTLFDAWANASARKRWLDESGVKVRTATAPKSMRLGWSDGTIVAVGFVSKGASKSSVAVEHSKLSDKTSVNRVKEYWSERFDALGDALANA